jgi:hypothetical protein
MLISCPQELQNAEALIARTNREVFNPKGLNALSPRDVALQFVSRPAANPCFLCAG